MSERRDLLESLLAHPGWQLFHAHVKDEWGPAGCWRKTKEIRDEAAQAVQRIDYTNEQVGKLMQWPSEEVARLARAEQTSEPVLSRGGYHR